MPDLIAQGPASTDRWRKTLPLLNPTDEPLVIGRTADDFATPWDSRVSRAHAMVRWDGETLRVERAIDARNPIYFRGQQDEVFSLKIGEHFVIGVTSFTLANQQVAVGRKIDEGNLVSEESFTSKELTAIRYRDSQRRIEALERLPAILGNSVNDEELVVRVVNVLMSAIRTATFIAIVNDADTSRQDHVHEQDELQILHWDSHDLKRKNFSPSHSLIARATELGRSVLHTWSGSPTAFTQMANVDWAFCVPIVGQGSDGWAIYVAGTLDQLSESDAGDSNTPTENTTVALHEEMKFAELTASTIAALRQSRFLQQRQDLLRPFFPPVIRRSIMQLGDVNLEPREVDVSVLFCDLRGFSQQSEHLQDRLLELLQRVSDALGVMTKNILASDGVIGDFHGDAAMGFWGWPIKLAGDNGHIHLAAKAALAIHQEFADAAMQVDHPLAGFKAGLGIASGRAVAGQIGTVDQVKITVFGPVVNLAARLETMTKQLFAPILIDEATASCLRQNSDGSARVRNVAKILPVGMKTPLMVAELLPAASTAGTLSDVGIMAYERALAAFEDGRWSDAYNQLHDVPASDRVKDFLTVYIAHHGRRPPSAWNGVIELGVK